MFSELKKTLPVFLANLNSLLSKLNFHKLSGLTLRDLDSLLEHLDLGNKLLFAPLDAKMTVYIFNNSYSKSGEQLKRQSFPIDAQLFQAFPSTFKALIHYIKYKLMRMSAFSSKKRIEIKFGLVFAKLSESKKKKIEKLEELIQNKRRESISKVSNDEKSEGLLAAVREEDKKAMEVKRGMNLSIQRADTMVDDFFSDEDYDGDFNEEMSDFNEIVQPLNESRRSSERRGSMRKNNDSSRKRAFTISKHSAKTLEAAIRKPRNAFKHKCTRLQAYFYSMFLILTK